MMHWILRALSALLHSASPPALTLIQPSESAQVFGATSMLFILCTIVVLVMGSLSQFQVPAAQAARESILPACPKCFELKGGAKKTSTRQQPHVKFNVTSALSITSVANATGINVTSKNDFYSFSDLVNPRNQTIDGQVYNSSQEEDTTVELSTLKSAHPWLDFVDMICVVWFTLEYILRLYSAPDLLRYIRTPFSIIDVLSILPFFIEITMSSLCICTNEKVTDLRKSMLVFRVLRTLRIFRVFRVLKLARYSTGIQLIGSSLQKSLPELAMLTTFVFIITIMLSTIMYYIETDAPDSKFYSIPQSAWWCIITFTTVGYGDIVPTTVPGKILAVIASFCGVVILAFPISIIVEKFSKSYAEIQNQQAAARRKSLALRKKSAVA